MTNTATLPAPSPAPTERGCIVAIFSPRSTKPIGTGLVIDSSRVLTSKHVVTGQDARDLSVGFPSAEDQFAEPVPVEEVRVAEHEHADVAVLHLAAALPIGVFPAPMRRPRGADLVGRSWWAYGFTDSIGNEASGHVGAALAYGWVRLDGESRYAVGQGFSGGGLWSQEYGAFVGLIGQALRDRGDGRCLTLHAAANAMRDEQLGELIDHWSLESAGEQAAAEWGWSLAEDVEGRRHWRPRARGVTNDAEQGYRFHGRDRALGEIISWIRSPVIDKRVLVVTGSPGVGKSAVLARIITTADRNVAAELPTQDRARRAPIGSIDCAVHAKGKTALEVGHEVAKAASAPLSRYLEDLVPGIRSALEERGSRGFTLVLDALDEVSDPEQARLIVRQLLLPLVEACSDLGAKVLVGTRRQDDAGDLIDAFGLAHREIDLDQPSYFEIEDLQGYAMATLQRRGISSDSNAYQDDEDAAPVAHRIASIASPNFLVAGLIARKHGLYDREPVSPSGIPTVPATADPVDVALRDYLARVPDAEGMSPAALLTPLAYAEAPGLDTELWSVALEAICGRSISSSALELFARQSAANFLIEESGHTGTFRLFHQALNAALLAPVRPEKQRADQASITASFLRLGAEADWIRAPAYLLRSLVHHASAGDQVDALLEDASYLLHADLRRVIPAAWAARSANARQAARLLRHTPAALDASPSARLALFTATEAIHGLGSQFQTMAGSPPYRMRWAHVQRVENVTTLDGHTGIVQAVCTISVRDRNLLASAGDLTVRVWDPSTGEHIRTLNGHTGWVRALCTFRSGDSELLASGGDQTVRLWNPASGQLLRTLRGHEGAVNAICVIAIEDREVLVSGGNDRTIRVWDPSSGALIRTFEGHADWVSALCAVRVGERTLLVSGGGDETVRLWDPLSGELIRELAGHTGLVSAVRVEGRDYVAIGGRDLTVRLWDPLTNEFVRVLGGRAGWVRAVRVVHVGERELLASGSGLVVRLWDPATGAIVRDLAGHTRTVRELCAVRVGNRELLASGGDDNTVRLWDPTDLDPIRAVEIATGVITSVCGLEIDSREIVASGSSEGTLRLWDGRNGNVVHELEAHAGTITAVRAVTIGGRALIASAGEDGALRLWDPTTGEPVIELAGHAGWALGLSAIRVRDRDLIASVGTDHKLTVWDPATGEVVSQIDDRNGLATAVCAVRVGTEDLLASAGGDSTVCVWDPATGALVREFLAHTGTVTALCVVRVADTELLASGGNDHKVALWDPSTGAVVLELEGHTGPISALCALRLGDQEVLVTGSGDKTVRVWDPHTAQTLFTVRPGTDVCSLAAVGDHNIAIGLSEGLCFLNVADRLAPAQTSAIGTDGLSGAQHTSVSSSHPPED